MGKKQQDNHSPRIVNRRAFHEFHISEVLEVGVVLVGSEVKSIRNGQASLAEGYAQVEPATMELFLYDVNIAQYQHAAASSGHEPTSRRKLLAHKQQISKLMGLTSARGVTLVPMALYFVRGHIKLELGVGQGKKYHDKRQSIKQRDAKREIDRAMTRKRI